MSPITPLSPSETAMGFTRGLTTKLSDMTDHGLMKSPVFAAVTTAKIDEFVKAVGPDLRDAFAGLVERSFEAFIGVYRIEVNYNTPNAIQSAIDANAFNNKYIYVEVSDIPVDGSGEAVEQVREVHFGKVMYNKDLPEALKQKGIEAGFPNGYMFANPLTSLKFAKKNPEKQVQAPRVVLFYIGEQLCYLYLYAGGGGRRLDVDENDPDDYWGDGVRFLVVPAPVAAPVPAAA